MASVDELFRTHERRLRGVVPGDPAQIEELEGLIGRPLPRELHAYLRLAGGDPGNLTFVQTHKTVRPTLSEALRFHRPRKHGARKRQEKPASRIFFGDAPGCQDCGPAWLVLSPLPDVKGLTIDGDDPPVAGSDDDVLQLLEPRFSDYVLRAIPPRPR